MVKLLCDVCPEPMKNRPCTDCGKVRAEMDSKAMRRAEMYDKRVHEMERVNRICVVTGLEAQR